MHTLPITHTLRRLLDRKLLQQELGAVKAAAETDRDIQAVFKLLQEEVRRDQPAARPQS